MTSLSTHVLDTMHGCPAEGIELKLFYGTELLTHGLTDSSGRMRFENEIGVGHYRLDFAVAAYFRARGADLPEPPFLDVVAIDFGVAEPSGHYHVPLLISPYAYSTYRGS